MSDIRGTCRQAIELSAWLCLMVCIQTSGTLSSVHSTYFATQNGLRASKSRQTLSGLPRSSIHADPQYVSGSGKEFVIESGAVARVT